MMDEFTQKPQIPSPHILTSTHTLMVFKNVKLSLWILKGYYKIDNTIPTMIKTNVERATKLKG